MDYRHIHNSEQYGAIYTRADLWILETLIHTRIREMNRLIDSYRPQHIGYIAPDIAQQTIREIKPLADSGIKAMERRIIDINSQLAQQYNNNRQLALVLLRKEGVLGIWGEACFIPGTHFYNLKAYRRFADVRSTSPSLGLTPDIRKNYPENTHFFLCETITKKTPKGFGFLLHPNSVSPVRKSAQKRRFK